MSRFALRLNRLEQTGTNERSFWFISTPEKSAALQRQEYERLHGPIPDAAIALFLEIHSFQRDGQAGSTLPGRLVIG